MLPVDADEGAFRKTTFMWITCTLCTLKAVASIYDFHFVFCWLGMCNKTNGLFSHAQNMSVSP